MELQWYDKLYVSEDMGKHMNRTINRLKRRKFVPGVYLLTLPTNEHNLLDIVPSWVLFQKNYHKRCPMIIGMAKSQESAYDLVEQILMETYKNTGNFLVEAYIEDRS